MDDTSHFCNAYADGATFKTCKHDKYSLGFGARREGLMSASAPSCWRACVLLACSCAPNHFALLNALV